MTLRFAKDDDPTEILQFRFLNKEGKVTRTSIKTAFFPPYPAKYYINLIVSLSGLTIFLLWNYGVIPGNKLGFFCKDPLFSHEYRGDTVTPVMLGLGIALYFPVIYFSVELIRQKKCLQAFSVMSLTEMYVYLKQFNVGLVIVAGITELGIVLASLLPLFSWRSYLHILEQVGKSMKQENTAAALLRFWNNHKPDYFNIIL